MFRFCVGHFTPFFIVFVRVFLGVCLILGTHHKTHGMYLFWFHTGLSLDHDASHADIYSSATRFDLPVIKGLNCCVWIRVSIFL